LSRLPVSGDRKSLLLGTALASTLLIGGILMPAPAGAVVNSCTDPGPDAVFINSAAPISCINTETRNEPGVGFAIELRASGAASYIYVHSSGELTASSNMQNTFGIFASTQDANSRIDVVNLGDVSVTATGNHHYAFGLVARTSGNGSPITSIVNSGDMSVTSENKYGSAYGIYARTEGADSGIYSIANSGTLVVTGGGTDGARAIGIFARTDSSDSPLSIVNSGDITVTATVETGTYAASAFGIFAGTYGQQQSHRHRKLRRFHRHRNRDRQ
jgi:autotransporter family porin